MAAETGCGGEQVVAPGRPSQTTAAAVSVIVPAICADEGLRSCLAALQSLDPPAADLIVVVDGGDAETAAVARAHGAQVVVLADRRGPAAARNAGARIARGDILMFADSDVTVRPDAIARVLSALDTPPGYDAVIGSYDDAPAATDFLSQYKNLAHHFVHQTSNERACTFWSACGAIRREAFERAGGFDERYRRASIEDIELGSRLVAGGSRIRLVKSLQITHLKRWRVASLLSTEIADRAIPWTRLILRTGRMPNDLNLRWSGRLAVAASVLLAGALAVAVLYPAALVGAAVLAGAVLALDAPLARFFWAKRGALFAARAMAWHWIHHLCSATGFSAGAILHAAEWLRTRATAGVQARASRAAADTESR